MTDFTQNQVQQRLDENNVPYAILLLGNGASVLICQYGGRILGPFLTQDSGALFWLNDVWKERTAFHNFIAERGWNLGGERMWVAPEIQYFVRDRQDFLGSYSLQPELDPGQYRLTQIHASTWQLQQHMNLAVYSAGDSPKLLTATRQIRPAPNPLDALSACDALMAGVVYAGYEQAITLSDSAPNHVLSATWSLIQVKPGGDVLIPASPMVETTVYIPPAQSNFQTIANGHVRIPITGRSSFKVGFKAAHVTGRAAYVQALSDGRVALFVRNFHNNPSAIYAEEPANLPGGIGQSTFVYNDDGNLGGFGELECLGQAIGGQSGSSQQTDLLQLWMYVGDKTRINNIATHLLGFPAQV